LKYIDGLVALYRKKYNLLTIFPFSLGMDLYLLVLPIYLALLLVSKVGFHFYQKRELKQ